jgi:endo-1,4-beta-xylanase
MRLIFGLLAFWPFLAFASLHNAYKDYFDIGVAVSGKQLFTDSKVQIINRDFKSVTAEYSMKWRFVEVQPAIYDFSWTDNFINYAGEHGKNVIGHTLVWHKNNPEWLFMNAEGKAETREQLLSKLQSYINTYVGRYRGKVKGWDVVNEAFNYDGSFRNTPWLEIIGEDYIEKAFEFAHQADPSAELYYNDYGLESLKKQQAVVALVKRLKKKGIPIHAVGMQGHYSLTYPDLTKLDKAIERFAKLGVEVMITELDVSVLPFPGKEERGEDAVITPDRMSKLNPFVEQLPDKIEQKLSERYVALFKVFLKHHKTVSRVTFWGITDAHSWRNNWPIPGRTDFPLLFDRNLKEKLPYKALIELPSR